MDSASFVECTAENGIIVADRSDPNIPITIRDVSFERCSGVAVFLTSSYAQLVRVVVAKSTAAETLSGIRKKHASFFSRRGFLFPNSGLRLVGSIAP